MQVPRASFRAWGPGVSVGALLVIVASSAGAGTWFTIAPDGMVRVNAEAVPQPPQVVVDWYDDTGLEVTVDVAGLEFTLEETGAGEFVLVSWPEAPLAGELGTPALPVVRRLLVVPQGATVALEVREGQAAVIDLAAAGFVAPVIPMQGPIPMSPGALERAPFHYDEAAYAADELLPAERAAMTALGIVRGWQLYLLEVRPVAYNPARGTLMVRPHIDVSLSFEGGEASGRRLLASLKGVLLNPPQPSGPIGRGSGNYLIVTASSYADSAPLTEFADTKTAQGFDVMVYSVPSGTHRSAIKNYIEDLWGTEDAPDYILLVGDTDGSSSTSTTIPHWSGGGASSSPTDLPYACMDGTGDWYPDIAVGRFSVRSVSTLQDVADKSLFVEAGDYPDPNYVKRAAFLATNDMSAGGEETHDWVIENYMDPAEFESIRIYARLGGDTQDIADAVNNGCLFTVYFGHSGSSGWWNPGFGQSDVQNLSNAGRYGNILSFSCNVGNYSLSECFGETWQRVSLRGAVSVIFPSTYIYWTSPPWHEASCLEEHFYESFIVEDIWEVGLAWQGALWDLLAQYGPSNPVTRDYFEMYNVLGDPSLLLPKGVGFALTPDPVSQNLCSPPADEAVYTIEVQQYLGFDEPVTLSASGEPPGSNVNFSLNSLPPPFTSVMTVSDITGGSPGDYTIEITGTAPSMERTAFVGLNLSTELPGLVTLLSPPDGAVDVPRKPTLIWEPASQAALYELQIATDPDFVNLVYRTTVTDASHTVANNLETARLHYWHVRAINGCGQSDYSPAFTFTTLEQADYFTEQFTGNFDLDNFTVEFIPDGSGDHYRMCGYEATELPTDPTGGTSLSISEDGNQQVVLDDGQAVSLYNLSYTSFYVCDNGYITFNGPDSTYNESLSVHFNQPRISALFDDLTVAGGTVSWKQLADRAVVTYQDVPEYGTSNSNTFQIEMFFDGQIHITWLDVASNDSIVGLSEGDGIPDDFIESDLSAAGPCGPNPPDAQSAGVSTPANTPVTITLVAIDDGLPDPPGALTYVILSLPSHGTLSDPGGDVIESVPYALVNGGNNVVYTPDGWYLGGDSFTFKANDGGTPPEGGDSNAATISIEVTPPDSEVIYSLPLDSDPGWFTEGQWAFGQPTGGGTHNRDPSAGHTGENVYGYNLAGDYTNNMPAYHLTTPALDCSGLLLVELRFWRWLGVERDPFDRAVVEVSNDGSNWVELWSNPTSSISDSSWSQMVLDVSAVADGEPTVYVRWAMGPTDYSNTYPGWNIDDVQIWAVDTRCPGDLDGDADVDLSDMSQLLAHYGMTSGAEYADGDLDGDGDVDLSDLSALLAVYGTSCP
ncbi:MAG: C25 family cysteine peptidase [Phycisphaerae bacterium]